MRNGPSNNVGTLNVRTT